MAPALLALADGTLFQGQSIGAAGLSAGEVVFNTSMTGYQEILTDPSYSRQIVTLTYPHIGNVGTNAEDNESDRLHVAGLVIRDLPLLVSNFRSEAALSETLRKSGVVGIAGIDTRRLTRILREKGAQNGARSPQRRGRFRMQHARSRPPANFLGWWAWIWQRLFLPPNPMHGPRAAGRWAVAMRRWAKPAFMWLHSILV